MLWGKKMPLVCSSFFMSSFHEGSTFFHAEKMSCINEDKTRQAFLCKDFRQFLRSLTVRVHTFGGVFQNTDPVCFGKLLCVYFLPRYPFRDLSRQFFCMQ